MNTNSILQIENIFQDLFKETNAYVQPLVLTNKTRYWTPLGKTPPPPPPAAASSSLGVPLALSFSSYPVCVPLTRTPDWASEMCIQPQTFA